MKNVRLRALKAITDVFNHKEFTKEAVEKYSFNLSEIDRGFLKELVYGVIRYRDTLDWDLKKFLERPQGLNQVTLNNLRLAVYQLRFTRAANYAVVNEAVEMEKVKGKPALVNGVLRNYIRADIVPIPDDNIAISTSHPQWLIDRWIERFGWKRASQLSSANNIITPMTLRAHGNRKEVSDILNEYKIKHEFTQISPDGIRLKDSISINRLGMLKCRFFIQDEAAQLASYLICPQKGEDILDACSAPGGKATHIAEITDDLANILAIDQSEKRINKIKDNIKTLKINSIKTLCTDILHMDLAQRFDKILLDPPCSSTGVIRKNPDVKYRISRENLRTNSVSQVSLLAKVSRYLKNGGLLLYCVCSTEPEEGEDVINMFLHKNSEFYIINVTNIVMERFGIDLRTLQEGAGCVDYYRTFPDINNTDGFFFCVLGKKMI
ncbi:MAG: 16S rRNA (cytosine(967)-C(5))-methyltransferase RsmB [Nitrospirae bacterium]|nr:16S rRNA (cytosine(967)-C(5))-methyltransferase RsmB [Nitrospirota bacterium]